MDVHNYDNFCIICRKCSQDKSFSINNDCINQIKIKNILYDFNFKLEFVNCMTEIICTECYYNLENLYNFRDYCCAFLKYSNIKHKCRMCRSKDEYLLELSKTTAINGTLYTNLDILKDICAYDTNSLIKSSDYLCTRCFDILVNVYGFYLKCNESQNFWTDHVLHLHDLKEPTTGEKSKQLKIYNKDEKVYKCQICSRSFKFKSNFKAHLRTHTGEKPYKCKICSKSFNQNATLKNHSKIHSNEKPHECKICFKSFKTKGNLKIHFRIHTGEKPYKCEVCLKSFSQLNTLKAHLKIHSNEKLRECKICFKSFKNKGKLKVHLRKHTDEKSYNCKVCLKSFSKYGTLKTHSKIHT